MCAGAFSASGDITDLPDCLTSAPIIDLTPGVKLFSPTLSVSACPHPFEQRRVDYVVPAGLTIAEIVGVIQPDPLLRAHGHVFLGEHLISREHWGRVRPKHGQLISIRLLPSGGGSGWRILAIIGVVILTIAAAVVGQYWVGPALATWLGATGTTAAAITSATAATMAAVVSTTGMLLVNTYLPPPVPDLSKNQGKDSPSYAITGQRNQAQNWSKVPFLLGRFKLTPPYAALPYREVVGKDIYWRTIFAFSHGPIAIEQMSIGETALGNFQDVEWQFRRGYWSMSDRDGWNAASGQFPGNPSFGDTWTCTFAGTAGGATYAAGETITFNGLAPASDPAAWDRVPGQAVQPVSARRLRRPVERRGQIRRLAGAHQSTECR